METFKTMSKFRKYEKIMRMGKDETVGLLTGKIHLMEKIDGANLQVWIEDSIIHIGSRNNDLTFSGNAFNGAVVYINQHEGINRLLKEHPSYRLYGEWLVKHTISYKETCYKKFYLFDIHTPEGYMSIDKVIEIAKEYDITYAPYHGVFENPSIEQLQEFVGKTEFGDRGEGIVLKNMEFINEFGDIVYGKIVTESFKEDNGVTFGGNNKHSDSYNEMYVVNKYMTLARIKKIMDKIQPLINETLGLSHIPRISGTAYHDMITEEIWEIANKVQSLNFTILKRIANKKAIQIYKDILSDSISVADIKNE
jgi:hypothetical protein